MGRCCFVWCWGSYPRFFVFLYMVLELERGAYTLSHSTSPFCVKYFQDRVSQTVCPAWLRTAILLISASQVARTTGVSHQHLSHPRVLHMIGTVPELYLHHIGILIGTALNL
jgi:hypothetical protein